MLPSVLSEKQMGTLLEKGEMSTQKMLLFFFLEMERTYDMKVPSNVTLWK
jgi:hypothetical protein